ncbi:cysteine desulfurase family protein [Sphingobium algorifonticola]|uniref:cysteine desulfurase family protein n=1 Tax=Sphingobium algorifonticola TaxID=2008318 RepID=UPI0013E31AEB|nr:cysteine desulfurase family protein [Sphingobium algorifonticola]
MIYLDHQASTSMHPAALAATQEAMLALNANPHAHEHAAGWRAADAIETARREIAEAIGGDPDEIVFTAGATEANNLALIGTAAQPGERLKLVVTAFEHKAVLEPARELERRGFDLVIAPVTRAGLVDLDALGRAIDEQTLLVSCMAVNNELGTVQPIEAVARLCRHVGALLHVDAAQALGWSAVDVLSFDADLVSLSAHKAGGPKGVGALWVRREIRDRIGPINFGGDQEGGLRPGTLPTALCIGFGAACRHLPTAAELDEWRARRKTFEQRLCKAFPGAMINGSEVERHPGAISLTFPDGDAETLILRLQPHVAISRGSACTSGIPEPSHVLRAICLDARACDRTVRISIGRSTTQDELDRAFEAIRQAYLDLVN